MANKKTITTWVIIILVIAITAIGIVVVNKSKDNKKGGDDVWVAEKFQSNLEIAGSPRNRFRPSLERRLMEVEH